MIKKPITINLSTGLEARPVAQLVQVASQFNSEIHVEIGKKKVNAKSRKSYYYGGGIGKSNAPSNANNTETAGQSEWDADD